MPDETVITEYILRQQVNRALDAVKAVHIDLFDFLNFLDFIWMQGARWMPLYRLGKRPREGCFSHTVRVCQNNVTSGKLRGDYIFKFLRINGN